MARQQSQAKTPIRQISIFHSSHGVHTVVEKALLYVLHADAMAPSFC